MGSCGIYLCHPCSFIIAKRLQIKTGQRARHLREGPGGLLVQRFSGPQGCIIPSAQKQEKLKSLANPGNSPKLWCPEFQLGLQHVALNT
jgi:hypothetical protein